MKNRQYIVFIVTVFLSIGLVAQETNTQLNEPLKVTESKHVVTTGEHRAKQLLSKAVAHIKMHGKDGVKDFSTNNNFIDNELYVFAMDMKGIFLASGGSSVVLVGDNVLTTLDVYGKPFFQEIITKAQHASSGVVEYYWTNPIDRIGSPKKTFFEKVEDIIIAVGYQSERSDETKAKRLLSKAVTAMNDSEEKTLEAFNQSNSIFKEDDLYVFVVDIETGITLANGAFLELVGRSHKDIINSEDKSVLTELLELAKKADTGDYTYRWVNPVTNKQELKHTYYQVVKNKIIAVGYYLKPNEY